MRSNHIKLHPRKKYQVYILRYDSDIYICVICPYTDGLGKQICSHLHTVFISFYLFIFFKQIIIFKKHSCWNEQAQPGFVSFNEYIKLRKYCYEQNINLLDWQSFSMAHSYHFSKNSINSCLIMFLINEKNRIMTKSIPGMNPYEVSRKVLL